MWLCAATQAGFSRRSSAAHISCVRTSRSMSVAVMPRLGRTIICSSDLGACTSMTVGLYARNKKWPLENIIVSLRHSRIHAKDCAECETKDGMLDRIDVEIGLSGTLTPEQRTKLMEIADKSRVHRTRNSEINIRLRTAPSGSLREIAETKIHSTPTQTDQPTPAS